MFLDRLRRYLLTLASQLGDERQASVRALFLDPFPCGVRGLLGHSGCCQVMLLSPVNIRQPLSWTACIQDWNCGLQWHLSPAILPLPHHYRAWKCWWCHGRGLVLWACTIKFLGGVQYAQYWPHPLHLWLICHGLASLNSDSIGFMSDCPGPRWIACQGCQALSAPSI